MKDSDRDACILLAMAEVRIARERLSNAMFALEEALTGESSRGSQMSAVRRKA